MEKVIMGHAFDDRGACQLLKALKKKGGRQTRQAGFQGRQDTFDGDRGHRRAARCQCMQRHEAVWHPADRHAASASAVQAAGEDGGSNRQQRSQQAGRTSGYAKRMMFRMEPPWT